MIPMLEVFIYETTTLLDQLDEILLEAEKEKILTDDNINEIFRTMHTIKGSAAMMGLTSISTLAHRVEDMFSILRETPSKMNDQNRGHIFDLVFQASDFFKSEIEAIQQNGDDYYPADAGSLIVEIEQEGAEMKGEAPVTPKPQPSPAAQPAAAQAPAQPEPTAPEASPTPAAEEAASENGLHYVRVFFEDGCQMENIRAFALLSQLKDSCGFLESEPHAPETNMACSSDIVKNGFLVMFRPAPSSSLEEIYSIIENAMNIKSYEDVTEEYGTVSAGVTPAAPAASSAQPAPASAPAAAAPSAEAKKAQPQAAPQPQPQPAPQAAPPKAPQRAGGAGEGGIGRNALGKQSLISVNQSKLDQLMALMGEIVIAESMATSNPELKGLQLDNFYKSARQLRKLTNQLQDVIMSTRMVSLTGVFQKMNRIVRDMNKNLGKEVELVTVGGETEVDKTINDVLGDPFMHMIRNSMDHGIESPEERLAAGKSEQGTITLSAQNVGGEIVISIADDGRGLDRNKILEKAERNGILTKPASDYSDKEVFGLIMLPGFSTNETATEYSGRGVGMDVVHKNLETVGGNISIDSKAGEGTTFTIKIPLTLAIVDGMEIAVKHDTFTIPITSIKQSFKLSEDTQLLTDTDGSEMIMLRGDCYPIIRLHEVYGIDTEVVNLEDGIFVQVENENKTACIFVDQLIGEQQVVVKSFPPFLNRYNLKDAGFSGCTIRGDGSISLILDINNFLNKF
ncbi:MAG: chemotaxis protein CheA [Oscillospiraceae bacterium]|nr:chemotaxis protein CheA [Oscillospiraceae bacterium]